jgi:hypothetical protein
LTMEPLGINGSLLLDEAFIVVLFISLPIISLIDLTRKGLTGILLAIWALIICIVPVIGSIAYWIIKPIPEKA